MLEKSEGKKSKLEEQKRNANLNWGSKLLVKISSSCKRTKETIARWAVKTETSKPLFIIVATIAVALVYIYTDFQKSH